MRRVSSAIIIAAITFGQSRPVEAEKLAARGLNTAQSSTAAKAPEVDAAALVQAVRESENWIHKVESLYIRIESKWSRTAEGIAARHSQLKEQYRNLDREPNRFGELKPISTGILEYAFDQTRLRFLDEQPDQWRQLKIWDGKQLIAHETYLSGEREYYYLHYTPQGNFHELIASQTSWLRTQPHSFWWDSKDVDEFLSYYGRPEEFVVVGRSNYRGVDCHVLQVYPTAVRGLVSVQSYPGCDEAEDHRQYGLIGEVRGLADQSYRWYIGTKDHLLHGLVWLINKKPRTEHWMLDYQQIRPGCWFPMTQGYEIYEKDIYGEVYLASRAYLKVADIRVNEELPNKLFQMELKEGIKVIDNRFGRSVTYTYKAEPPDLVGSTLPKFSDIKIHLDSEQAKDKIMLVCFWDMDQRPSRYCIRQLAKQAEQLKQKGITVVAVHASEVAETKLNGWIKKYDIPFPVGLIGKDIEKVRLSWGVKSLPWLILNDQQHIVRSNGFSLAELDEKIKAISQM